MIKSIFTSDGVKISYQILRSTKEKGTIVFLHGLTGSGSAFQPILNNFLSDEYSLLIPDFRSHGLSGNSSKFSLDLFENDLKSILKNEKLKNIYLVGHCFGTLVAFDFAQKNPQVINDLILISPPFGNKNFRSNFIKHMAKISNLNIKKFENRSQGQVDYQELKRFKDWDKTRMLSDWKNTSIKTLLELLRLIGDYKTQEKIKFPFKTLLIHGQKDTVAPVENSIKLAEIINPSELIILPGLHHVDIVLDPKSSKFDKIILDFLKKGSS